MNILITGTSGFLSKELKRYFIGRNTIITVDRKNLLNLKYMSELVKYKNIDIILHTSWAGVINTSPFDLQFNVDVHNNILELSKIVKKVFLFGSGAEVLGNPESDYYKGKLYAYITSKNFSNIINLRLYGCFGLCEDPKRFIKSSVLNILTNRQISIHQDKYMDFIFVDDLCSIIEHYIANDSEGPKNLDCVYDYKLKLSDIAKYLNTLFGLDEDDYNVEDSSFGVPYVGSCDELKLLNLKLVGLKNGIRRLYGNEAENFRLGRQLHLK